MRAWKALLATGLCNERWEVCTIGSHRGHRGGFVWETRISWLLWPDFNYQPGGWVLTWGRLSAPVRSGKAQPRPQMTWMSRGTVQHLCVSVSWAVMSWAEFNAKSSFFCLWGIFFLRWQQGWRLCLDWYQSRGMKVKPKHTGVQMRDPSEVLRVFPSQKGAVGQSWRDVRAHVVSNTDHCSVPMP